MAESAAAAGITILPVPGLPEIEEGSDLPAMIAVAASKAGTPLADGDVIIITSKIVSKSEGHVVRLGGVTPSHFASEWAAKWEKDPRVIELVLRESRRIVRQAGPVLITETNHGFVCANAGVDQSSSGGTDRAVLLPEDPDASARQAREGFAKLGADVAVIISDTFGRPWREAQTDIAIGIAGMDPVVSYIGQTDPHGHEFKVQAVCRADELAAAAELVKGNTSRIPVSIIRGYDWRPDDDGTMQSVIRDPSADLFR